MARARQKEIEAEDYLQGERKALTWFDSELRALVEVIKEKK
jgi:hypothetical protein